MDETNTRNTDERGSTRRRFLAGVTAAGAAASTLAVTAADAASGSAAATGLDEDGGSGATAGSGIASRRNTAAQTWEMYAADVRNTGRNNADAPSSGVAVNWHRDLGAHTEATFDRQTTYVGSDDGTLYALDRPTGETDWTYETDETITSAPVVRNGNAYVTSGSAVVAIRTTSQRELWRTDLDGEITTPLTVTSDRILVGTDAETTHSLSVDSGTVRWTYDAADTVESAPAVDGGRVFVLASDGTLAALNDADGRERWVFESDARTNGVTPVTGNDRVYVGDASGTLYAVDQTNGLSRWSAELDAAVVEGPAMTNSTTYVPTEDGTVHALRARGGDERWTTDVDDTPSAKPVLGDDALYVPTVADTVFAFNHRNGTEQWSADLPVDDPQISIVDDTVAVVGGAYVSLTTGPESDLVQRSLDDGVETRWTTALDGDGTVTPVVAGDTVYVGDDESECYALATDDGGERWRFDPNGDVRGLAVDDGTVYLSTDAGTVTAVSADDGSERWSYAADGPVSGAAVAGGHVLSTGAETLYAVDTNDGDERWTASVGGSASDPVVGRIAVYVGASGVVVAFGLDGGQRWRANGDGTFARPAVTRSRVYAASDEGVLVAFDRADGTEQWQTTLDGTALAGPAVSGDTVYVGTDGGTLTAVDTADGSTRWTTDVGAPIQSQPLAVGDVVYVGDEADRLTALDASGEIQWRYDTGKPLRTTPAAADETLYVASADLAALDPPGTLPTPTQTPTATQSPGTTDTTPGTDGETTTAEAGPGTETQTPHDDPGADAPGEATTTAGGSSGTTVPPGGDGTANGGGTPTPTTPGGDGSGSDGDDSLSLGWLPYAGAGGVAALAVLAGLVKLLGGGDEPEQPKADALTWGEQVEGAETIVDRTGGDEEDDDGST